MAEFTKEDTQLKVVDLIVEKLNIEKNMVKLASQLQDLGADSLDLVEIIMKLEELFGVEIDDADAEKLLTVEEVVDYIHTKRTR